MILFPAIDILSRKAVRLYKGDYNQVTVYSDKPWQFAEDFVTRGCSAIHIVDLDGARSGETVNIEIVKRISIAGKRIILNLHKGLEDREAYFSALLRVELTPKYIIIFNACCKRCTIISD